MSTESIFKSDSNDTQALISEFFSLCNYYTEEEKSKIIKAWNFLTEHSKGHTLLENSTEPFHLHPLRVAYILSQNNLDISSIISAILHSVNQLGVSEEEIKKEFGEVVYKIITTTNKILNLPINTKNILQSDAIRKMFFAMSDDARIILITLADRLDRIRNIKLFPHDYQKLIAESCIDIWAPLADRLGMQKEKNEFEDLSLKYTNPAVFQQIKAIVSQKKDERAAYLNKAVQSIYKASEKLGIKIVIQSRAKHFYSIYQKMRKRNKEAGELYDLFALRILCDSQSECYTAVGIVHSLWKPLDGRFKDYIAMPKSNGYQSLHTTVMCEGRPLEIQIRTHQMHNLAEHGIASHWLYKKGSNRDFINLSELDIINRLQSLKQTQITDEGTFSNLKNELLGDEIYVFTPKGEVKKLPAGSTAIDFAYSIHSAIGEKIIAAKADGKIIPLNKPLQNTQIIEIITNPNAHPTEAQLKIVKTNKAHQKIHAWLTVNEPTFGEQPQEITEQTEIHQKKKRAKKGEMAPAQQKKQCGILIQGDKHVLYNIAQCCKPEYPDIIAGYVTRSKGITIHRADCLIYQRIPEKEKRSIQVSWDD